MITWIVVGSLVLTLAIFVLRIRDLVRLFPKGQRLRNVPYVLRLVHRASTRNVAAPTTSEIAWLSPPNAAVSTVGWSAMADAPDLVKNARRVSQEGSFASVQDVDADGSALIFRYGAEDSGYSWWLEARDGTRTDGPQGAFTSTGSFMNGCVDRGAVAWLHDNPQQQVAEVWRWDLSEGARVIHSLDYRGQKGPGAVSGWVLLAGDIAVVTFAAGRVGTVVAIHPQHGAVHLASVSILTLHRDLVAEQHGMHRAAVNLYVPNEPKGVVAELDLDVWPPTVTPIAKDFFPGASTQLGKVLGFLREARVLRFPSTEEIAFGRQMALDPIGDGTFTAFGLFQLVDAARKTSETSAIVVRIATGTRTVLTTSLRGRTYMRGGFVAWSQVASPATNDGAKSYTGVTSWVAELAPVASAG